MTALGTINDLWPLQLTADRLDFYADRLWEFERLASMRRHLGADDTIADVGAECGDLPALWASWGVAVIAVEPQPRYWPSIKAHFDANRVHPRGWFVGFASDRTCALNDVPRGGSDGWPECAFGPIEPDVGFCHLGQQPEIQQVRLDDLDDLYGPVSAITIDCEGSELRVLKGAERLLASHQVKNAWVSLHTDQPWMDAIYPGEGHAEVIAYMAGHGYVCEELAVDHERHVRFHL